MNGIKLALLAPASLKADAFYNAKNIYLPLETPQLTPIQASVNQTQFYNTDPVSLSRLWSGQFWEATQMKSLQCKTS